MWRSFYLVLICERNIVGKNWFRACKKQNKHLRCHRESFQRGHGSNVLCHCVDVDVIVAALIGEKLARGTYTPESPGAMHGPELGGTVSLILRNKAKIGDTSPVNILIAPHRDCAMVKAVIEMESRRPEGHLGLYWDRLYPLVREVRRKVPRDLARAVEDLLPWFAVDQFCRDPEFSQAVTDGRIIVKPGFVEIETNELILLEGSSPLKRLMSGRILTA